MLHCLLAVNELSRFAGREGRLSGNPFLLALTRFYGIQARLLRSRKESRIPLADSNPVRNPFWLAFDSNAGWQYQLPCWGLG